MLIFLLFLVRTVFKNTRKEKKNNYLIMFRTKMTPLMKIRRLNYEYSVVNEENKMTAKGSNRALDS